jgi:CheY-like chemotaxis protein
MNHPSLQGRRILIVEDEMMVAWRLGDMLAAFGCTVVGVADRVDEALAMVDEQQVDAVVLDVNLQGRASYPVADRLLARGIPFVLTTGYPRNRLEAAYRVFPYLLKPYSQSDLQRAVLDLLAPNAAAA